MQALREHQKTAGTLPSHFRSLLDDLLGDSVIPWTVVLRQLVSARILARSRATMKKFHKKRSVYHVSDEDGSIIELAAPIPQFPGKQRMKTFNIVFAIDTSGSMSNEDVHDGLEELAGLVRADPEVQVLVVQCDTNISALQDLSTFSSVKDYINKIGRTSGGGTSFAAPFSLTNFLHGRGAPPLVPEGVDLHQMQRDFTEVNLIVYITDGYGTAPEQAYFGSVPVIWCITPNGTAPTIANGGDLYGTLIQIPPR